MFEKRVQEKSGTYSFERENAYFEEHQVVHFMKNKKAWDFFRISLHPIKK
ncbi:MAG: hypothetical protein HC906_13660 [Bacteroidales bacterium]|nr:hypothetical protein [Bacteroidales bacterium]